MFSVKIWFLHSKLQKHSMVSSVNETEAIFWPGIATKLFRPKNKPELGRGNKGSQQWLVLGVELPLVSSCSEFGESLKLGETSSIPSGWQIYPGGAQCRSGLWKAFKYLLSPLLHLTEATHYGCGLSPFLHYTGSGLPPAPSFVALLLPWRSTNHQANSCFVADSGRKGKNGLLLKHDWVWFTLNFAIRCNSRLPLVIIL